MSIIDTIIDEQTVYYKKHKRAVSMLMLNKTTYSQLLRELDTDTLGNLHGMQIIINSKNNIKLI
jgi:hypothetical protein